MSHSASAPTRAVPRQRPSVAAVLSGVVLLALLACGVGVLCRIVASSWPSRSAPATPPGAFPELAGLLGATSEDCDRALGPCSSAHPAAAGEVRTYGRTYTSPTSRAMLVSVEVWLRAEPGTDSAPAVGAIYAWVQSANPLEAPYPRDMTEALTATGIAGSPPTSGVGTHTTCTSAPIGACYRLLVGEDDSGTYLWLWASEADVRAEPFAHSPDPSVVLAP